MRIGPREIKWLCSLDLTVSGRPLNLHRAQNRLRLTPCFCAGVRPLRESLFIQMPLSSLCSINLKYEKKSLFSLNYFENNRIQSPVWASLAKIMEITVIVWGRQISSSWWAAGKYRWRRKPEGQYSLLYDLSHAALNFPPAVGSVSRRAAAHVLTWSPFAAFIWTDFTVIWVIYVFICATVLLGWLWGRSQLKLSQETSSDSI